MAHTGNSDKSNQFNEFFSIQSNFNVNINFVDTKQNTSFDNFIQQIPTPFKMAGDISSIDNSALKPLQALSGVANQLVEYLNYQNKNADRLRLSGKNSRIFRYIQKEADLKYWCKAVMLLPYQAPYCSSAWTS